MLQKATFQQFFKLRQVGRSFIVENSVEKIKAEGHLLKASQLYDVLEVLHRY